MPYNYAHALVGFAALKNCKNLDQVGILSHLNVFFLGTMGPDPYYGDSYPPPLFSRARIDLADKLHAFDLSRLLHELLALSEGNDVRTAYAMGLLCHVVLDNHVHPYIEARYPGKAHTPAEISMDMALVQRGSEPRLSVSPADFYHMDCMDEIDALHAEFFSRQFGLATRGIYARSLKKWLRLNAFLYDPHGRKTRFFRSFPKLTQYLIARRPEQTLHDLLNLSHASWAAPWSPAESRNASVCDLMDAAVEEICYVIDRIASGERETALSALEGRCADAAGSLY